MHGRERRLSPRAPRRDRRRARRARADARHRIDRPQRRRRAPSVLERGEHPAVDRIDRVCSSASPTKSASRSTFTRTATCSCCRRRRASRRSGATSRCSAASASTCSGSTRGERRAARAGARRRRRDRGATFCQRDGIADPNGVTMGFAKAAQAAGVSIERDTEVTGIRVEPRPRRRRRDDARHDRDADGRQRGRTRTRGRSDGWPASTCRSIRTAATSSSRPLDGGSERPPARARRRTSW